MPQNEIWQARKFGPAASTIQLATKGGATLGGIWISAKGTTPVLQAFDTASATPSLNVIVASHTPTAVGMAVNLLGGIGCGNGLAVKVASATGTILFRPSNAGV